MKNFKRISVFIMAIFMTIMLVACGGDKNNNNNNGNNNGGNNGNVNPPINYTITFMVDNEVYVIKQVASGNKVEKPEEDPSKTNYAFAGWYNGENLWNFETGVVQSNLTLTAKFDLIYYEVKFMVEDEVFEIKNIASGGKVIEPETNPSKTNYAFAGWYNGETEWNFETGVVQSNLTLTAKFDLIYYEVKFMVEDEVFEIKNIASGGKVIEPETNPSKINYAFVGWYNGETLWDFDTNIVTKNITLIAKFNLTHYSVEFLVDGEILETRAVVPGKKLVKPENPNKENYIFAGWYNGETLWNFENDVVNENITLTAKFDENAKIDGIDIKINNFELKESPAIGKYYYKTVSNVREIYNFKDDIETPQELKWFVAYNVSGTDKIESTLTEIAVGDNKFYLVVESGNIKETYILVVRRRPMYEVLFDTNGGTKVETQIIEEDFFASVPTEKVEKTGYDFIGWDYDFSMPVKENLIINAKYIPIVYTATFKDDGEYVEERTFIIEDTEILNIPSVPNKVGYTAKWEEYEIKAENITINAVYTPIIYTARFVINSETYTTRTFTIEDSEILDMPRVPSKAGYTGEWESYEIKAENLTIKALLINYTATFIINGETYTTRTFTIEDSEILDMPSVPTKAGYTGKWESYKIKAENIEIKAELITYTANFVINGSTYKTRKFTIEDSEILDKPSVPTKAGYTGEWESYEIKAENIVVNAVYTIINYTATFKADGDVVDTRTFTINDDEIADIPSVPNKMGYTGKWESYTLTLQDIEVNAIYSPVVYTATFKVDGMNNDTRTFTVEDTEISNIPSIPSKAGYTGEWESYEIKAEDLEINAIYTPIIYTARFVIGGETYETRTFTIEDSEISNIPSVPSKAGYTGEWESYEIKAENLVIKAELIIYTASFVADDVVVDTRTFTVEDSEISNMPSVPEKDDLVGTWEKYTLKAEDIVINAVYKEEFIKIKTKEELLDFVSNENNYRKNVILDADIDLEGMEWKPILFYNETKYQYGYWGIFDGNGHTISNYKINKKITSADDIDYYSIYSGFFGFIYDASICNLNLSNYVVEITFDVDEQILDGVDGLVGYYGGLVGGCSNSEITNCSVSGDIIIKDTYNKGNLTITGGLIGAAGNCIIDNCHSSGNIITSSCVVGGLVGGYDGLISNSYSTVNIKCQNCIFICAVGGLVASSTSLIMTDCYFAGDIELILDSDLDVFVGGLVAMLESSTITNCYVSGTVQVNSENYLQLESLYTYFYIGGFAGYIGDTVTIKNCYREGNLDVTLTVFSDGNYAYGYIGNFIGYVESNLNIENSYSAGDVNVNVTGDGDTGITFYIGGLIGYISEITDYEKYTKITNCYSSTNITGVMNSSTSYDSIVTGGLVAGANSSIITNCYASGNISATNKINENVVISCYAGGLFGYKNGVIIENCYRYNGQKISATIEYSRETRNGDICTEGTNRSMQVIWTFILENWDSEVWNLYSDKNPTLKIA